MLQEDVANPRILVNEIDTAASGSWNADPYRMRRAGTRRWRPEPPRDAALAVAKTREATFMTVSTRARAGRQQFYRGIAEASHGSSDERPEGLGRHFVDVAPVVRMPRVVARDPPKGRRGPGRV